MILFQNHVAILSLQTVGPREDDQTTQTNCAGTPEALGHFLLLQTPQTHHYHPVTEIVTDNRKEKLTGFERKTQGSNN